jgi:hypothetical protein
LDPSYLLKTAHTTSVDVGRPGAGVTSYFLPLPSDGAAIATCTALENACCLHAFADAKMENGQAEWRIMVQIGCWCAPWTSRMRSSLELVRGSKAREPRGAGRVAPAARGSGGGGLSGEGGGGGGGHHPEAAAEAAVRARARCEQRLVTE